PGMQPVLLVVTDGEPTAQLLPDGESWFSYPPEPATVAATVAELDRISRAGAQTTFFRLGDGLESILEAMARRAGGTSVAPEVDDLRAAVVGEFLPARYGRADLCLDRDASHRASPAQRCGAEEAMCRLPPATGEYPPLCARQHANHRWFSGHRGLPLAAGGETRVALI